MNEISDALAIRQPQVSKHLRVLSETGIVTWKPLARRRVYQLEEAPFEEINRWVGSFERLWETRLDSLDDYLNSISQTGEDRE